MKLISVIIPCYNQAQFLPETLQSVLNQTYTNWECIIVNDGSPDHTEEVALEWCEKDERFIYIKKENGGLSSARNFGIESSNGFYILPLDSDDFISNNYVEVCLINIERSIDIKVVYGKAIKFGAENCNWELKPYSFQSLLRQNVIFCTAMYRKADWELVNGYDTSMIHGLEDWEFWINILKKGGTALCVSECVFYYRIKQESMLVNLLTKKNQIHEIYNYVFNKHSEVYTKHSYYDLYLIEQEYSYKFSHLSEYISIKEVIHIFFKKIISKLKSLFILKNKIKKK